MDEEKWDENNVRASIIKNMVWWIWVSWYLRPILVISGYCILVMWCRDLHLPILQSHEIYMFGSSKYTISRHIYLISLSTVHPLLSPRASTAQVSIPHKPCYSLFSNSVPFILFFINYTQSSLSGKVLVIMFQNSITSVLWRWLCGALAVDVCYDVTLNTCPQGGRLSLLHVDTSTLQPLQSFCTNAG